MKKLLLTFAALIFSGLAAYAVVTLPPKITVTGPGLIPGSTINTMIDAIKELQTDIANDVSGVAAGYKLARGETALDGTNPTPVTTGLATIVACTTTIKLATAPGVGTSIITDGSSTGTLNLYGWKVTSSSDTTLIASTGTETIGWVCVGT